MRTLAILAVTAAMLSFTGTASAQGREYPWCARYDVWTMNCGFATLQQCRETISGVGGICSPNPRFSGYAQEPRPRRHFKRKRAHRH